MTAPRSALSMRLVAPGIQPGTKGILSELLVNDPTGGIFDVTTNAGSGRADLTVYPALFLNIGAGTWIWSSSAFRAPSNGSLGELATYWTAAYVKSYRTTSTTLTDGATVTPDLALSNEQILSRAGAGAWTLANPVNAPGSGVEVVWRLTIRNTSGGAIAAPTLDTLYKSPALTMPANGQSRTWVFRWNGTNHVLITEMTRDVPN